MTKRMKVFALIALLATVVACSSSDQYEPPPVADRGPIGQGRGGFRGAAQGDGMQGALEGLPPGTWWRDPQITTLVNLSSEQFAALDKIESEQGDEIARLERDAQVPARQLRDALDVDPVRSEDIIAAGQRLRAMRDNILDRQVRLLAAERTLLSRQQWTALQDALQSRRSERMQDRRGGSRGRGGRGGGMGGRRPGWPG